MTGGVLSPAHEQRCYPDTAMSVVVIKPPEFAPALPSLYNPKWSHRLVVPTRHYGLESSARTLTHLALCHARPLARASQDHGSGGDVAGDRSAGRRHHLCARHQGRGAAAAVL